jgi:hypothetical protein
MPEPLPSPGAALTKAVALLLFTGLFWWVSVALWPQAILTVVLLGLATVGAFWQTYRAHRAHVSREVLIRKAERLSDRYDSRGAEGEVVDGWREASDGRK